ncbi:tyrosine-type recombinase/integrase [Thalassospira sp. MCCC 1A01428]|uniref:tyrosine-type recombinase/integrase n=1 Tax=Thalassospira sp. MCCC 1A01428 TaxID=1470575 RepID=UPI000A1D8AD1|nr:tyrosine-type recombinase/integrase [Thalassospira sp. MCCC 1A01428]
MAFLLVAINFLSYLQIVMTVQHIRSPNLPTDFNSIVVTDTRGLPRYWPTVWEALHGNALRKSTLSGKFSAIDRLYRFVADLMDEDCLDSLLFESKYSEIESCLEAYFISLRNDAGRGNKSNYNRNWKTAFEFVREILIRNQVQNQNSDISFNHLNQRIKRIERLYASLNVKRRPRRRPVRALPASVIEDLYEIADPLSKRNPFRSESHRWRNYSLFLLYLHQGIRRSEALVLPVDAIKQDWDETIANHRYWINVTDNEYEIEDPRFLTPGIKTDLSHRQIPLSRSLSQLIQFYLDNYRGRQPHSFMFASNRKQPLSVPSINVIFDRFSAVLANTAKRDLYSRQGVEKVTPHDCRHTCAVFRLRQFVDYGLEMEIALQNLRVFFGWSKNSDMPRHYARAFFEDRLNSVWNSQFDERVTMLRQLSSATSY